MSRSTAPRPDPGAAPRRGAQGGFTLLEVLVAFGLLALLLGVLFQAFSGGLRASGSAERRVTAVLLAKSQLAALAGAGDLAPGTSAGELPGGHRWRAAITVYDDAVPDESARLPLVPYRVELTVSWDEGSGFGRPASAVTLTTLVLGGPP